LRDLITGQHTISALREHVARSGVVPLAQVAAAAVARNETTLEEVRRVVGLA
jgi:general secretion pathway protein E